MHSSVAGFLRKIVSGFIEVIRFLLLMMVRAPILTLSILVSVIGIFVLGPFVTELTSPYFRHLTLKDGFDGEADVVIENKLDYLTLKITPISNEFYLLPSAFTITQNSKYYIAGLYEGTDHGENEYFEASFTGPLYLIEGDNVILRGYLKARQDIERLELQFDVPSYATTSDQARLIREKITPGTEVTHMIRLRIGPTHSYVAKLKSYQHAYLGMHYNIIMAPKLKASKLKAITTGGLSIRTDLYPSLTGEIVRFAFSTADDQVLGRNGLKIQKLQSSISLKITPYPPLDFRLPFAIVYSFYNYGKRSFIQIDFHPK